MTDPVGLYGAAERLGDVALDRDLGEAARTVATSEGGVRQVSALDGWGENGRCPYEYAPG